MAPLASPSKPTVAPQTTTAAEHPRGRKREREAARQQAIFIEYFAGSGSLTKAVQKMGICTEPAEDLDNGGLDFGQASSVKSARSRLSGLAQKAWFYRSSRAPVFDIFAGEGSR